MEKEKDEDGLHNDVTDKLKSKPDNDSDILESVLSHVGDMGLYQKLLLLGMMPFGCFFAWVYFVQMFIAVTPQNHWCRIPELANLSMELRRNLSAPGALTGEWDRCTTFDTNWTRVLETLTPPPVGTPMVPCQHGWEFEFNDIPYETVTSERGWVCDAASNVPTAHAVFFIGSVTGVFIIGLIADYFGRVPALMVANIIGGIGGIATIYTTGVWDFIFCRFLVGMALDNCYMVSYILLLEYVGTRYRSFVANAPIALFFGGSAVALPWIAYYVADWRKFLWITSLPMFIVLPAPWLIPESVRWLVSQGRVNQAVQVLKKFESINGTQIPDDVLDEFIISSNKCNQKKNESFSTMFKSVPLRRTMIMMIVVYMGCGIMFDGLVRLCNSFGLDFFATFAYSSSTEVPSVLLLAVILDRSGRRNLTAVTLALAGIFTSIAIFVPKSKSSNPQVPNLITEIYRLNSVPRLSSLLILSAWHRLQFLSLVQAILVAAARFFINMCFGSTIQWVTELLPTSFRASGSSVLHMSGFVARIFTPYVVYSERVWSLLPLVILTVTAFVAAGISLTLPETKGLAMPQTIADGEKIIREQSISGKPENAEEGHYTKNIEN